MHRNIIYSEDDYYLSYLNISLHNNSTMRLCGGKFAFYLEKKFGIKTLPYNIKLAELILSGEDTDELFVALPKEYFLCWDNYPRLGRNVESESSDVVKDAGYYDIRITSCGNSSLFDLIHPYDSFLNESFREKFKANHPNELTVYVHPNGHKFRPYESYMAYWRAYIIFEVVQECKFIERYLNKIDGVKIFKHKYNEINKLWVDKYSSSFNRLALFRSFITRLKLSNDAIKYTGNEISDFLLCRSGSSLSDLKSDMTILLELHQAWEDKLKSSGLVTYKSAINLLKKDIYFLFDWLCYAGMKDNEIFENWSYKNRQTQRWSQLKDVLDFEEIKFFESFETYIPYYAENIKNWLFDCEWSVIYDHLKSLDGFQPWIRGFYDLHEHINTKDDIRLVQPRVIDNLLILSIRTEIIIRDICCSLSGTQESYKLRDVLLTFSKFIEDDKSISVLQSVVDKQYWGLTELGERPEDLFARIDACNAGKNWSKKQKYFFKQLLKFVTSRNYFAHHFYKDGELNNYMTELCRDVFVSCVHSVLYITVLSMKGISETSGKTS